MVKNLRETVIKLFKGEEPSEEEILDLLKSNLVRYSEARESRPRIGEKTPYTSGEWEDLERYQVAARYYGFAKLAQRFRELMEKGQEVEGDFGDDFQL